MAPSWGCKTELAPLLIPQTEQRRLFSPDLSPDKPLPSGTTPSSCQHPPGCRRPARSAAGPCTHSCNASTEAFQSRPITFQTNESTSDVSSVCTSAPYWRWQRRVCWTWNPSPHLSASGCPGAACTSSPSPDGVQRRQSTHSCQRRRDSKSAYGLEVPHVCFTSSSLNQDRDSAVRTNQ